ncbi:MAG: dienelactone hydrolase family protein [Chloroflexi bacterium]|nr:dienelactone hydrolase family protein [Chloroflexota bacterium]
MSGQVITIDGAGSRIPAYVAIPDGPGAHQGVVVAMHIFGIDRFVRGKCDELAEAGFVAIAPYLFHRTDVSHEDLGSFEYADASRWERMPTLKATLKDDEVVEDMLAAASYLRNLDTVGPRLGVTGFCIGGRIAYLMAVRTDAFSACADFYGGEIESSWGDGMPPLEQTDRLNCALAGFFGNDDYNPTPAAVDRLEEELRKHNKPYEFHRYDGTNHAFNDPFNPDRWREHAGTDSLEKLTAFFRRELTVRGSA